MKIAILVPRFPPRYLAGTEIATQSIARLLVKRGYKVHVITSRDKELPENVLEEGVNIHRIGFPRVRVLGPVTFRLKTLLLLKKLNPDIVHAQSVGLGICALAAKKLYRKPFLVWWRSGRVPSSRWDLNLSGPVLKNADAVIALTEDAKKQIQKLCKRQILIVPNAIELSEFSIQSSQTARRALGIAPEESIILFVGGLRLIKGLEFLIRAMGIIHNHNQESRLMIVGEGRERQALESLTEELGLNDTVRFIGDTPHSKVAEYMAAADVFVLPSLSEGFPNVLLEAMAAGLPVVATNVSGIPEIIKDGENGFLVPSKDPETIAQKTLQILGDKELKNRFSENNRAKVEEYNPEKVIARLEEIYASLVDNPKQRA